MTPSKSLANRSRIRRLLCTICLLSTLALTPRMAGAYVVNLGASITSALNTDCTATYEGLHFVQFLDVQPADEGKFVGLDGRLYKLGNILQTAVVSQCSTGGVLPQKKIYFCETERTQPCLNPSGPAFQAKSFSLGVTESSEEDRIVCAEGK